MTEHHDQTREAPFTDDKRFQQLTEEDKAEYGEVPLWELSAPHTEDARAEQKRANWIKWRAAPYPADRHAEYLFRPAVDGETRPDSEPLPPRILISAVLELPESIDAYVSSVSPNHRYDIRGRKATNKGYTTQVISPAALSDQIWNIVHSCDERQGRAIAPGYLQRDRDSEFPEYAALSDPHYRDICLGVFDSREMLCAYLLGKRVGDHVQYDEIMGHAAHLKQGVMYLLHYDFVALCLRQDVPPRCLNYGPWYSGSDPFDATGGLNRWKRKARFKPCYLAFSES